MRTHRIRSIDGLATAVVSAQRDTAATRRYSLEGTPFAVDPEPLTLVFEPST